MNQNQTIYRPDIDGLRAVAVLAVVLHHLSASLVPGGYIGVDVFFVISGYLITRIISREMEEGSFTFASFYERRARRIFPALFAVLGVTVLVGYFLLLPSDYTVTLRGALGTLFFASNIVFWRDMAEGYFATVDAELNPLLHMWSLAVEEQFYLLFPLVLLSCYRYFRRHIVLILATCALVSLAAAALLVQSKSVAVFFLSPFRAWELLAGSLLAFNAVPVLKSRLAREFVAGAGLLAILVACFVYDAKTTFPGFAALAPVLGAAAIMHAGASGPSLVGRLLQWRPVVYIGLISYSLYLWHWPLIVLTRYAMGMEPITQYIPVLLVASLVLGSLSYHFIEQPFRSGKRMTRQFIFSSSALFVSMMAGVAVLGLVRGGFEERFTPTVVQLDRVQTQQVPFRNCDRKPAGAWCSLGQADGHPTVLLWGDSHMLAWAPALNHILNQQNIRAIFPNHSSCPPLFGVNEKNNLTCLPHNTAVKKYLLENSNIKTVIMSSYWSIYFRNDGRITASDGRPTSNSAVAAGNALIATLQWLHDNGKQAILIGPVPFYSKNIPHALALAEVTGREFILSTQDKQRQENAHFLSVIDVAKRGGGKFLFLDPIQWLCANNCMVKKDGVVLYRDSDHLSAAGAMALETNISQSLLAEGIMQRHVGQPATASTP